MTNEEKVIQILDKHYGYHVNQGSDMWYTGNYQDMFAHLIEMAEWKDKQFKEFLEKCIKTCEKSEVSVLKLVFEAIIKDLEL
jgi:hypothetical protein